MSQNKNDKIIIKINSMQLALELFKNAKDVYLDAGLEVEALSTQAVIDARKVQLASYMAEHLPIVESK